MDYILIGNNDIHNIKETILKNRGIKDIDTYLNLNQNVLYDYSLLDNINKGVELLKKIIENKLPIYIVVDCDPDGYCSASILYDYIKTNLNYTNLIYILQEGKKHGLSKEVMNILLAEDQKIGLIVLPDAGTNDIKQCKELFDIGYSILILDHHQKEEDNSFAIVINNQACDYPNKNLCGAGIVYRFLCALDDEYWLSNANDYIDLVALANISDVMDLRECETKYLVDTGLNNIVHPLFLALLNRQNYSIKNIEFPTINDISFYITPLINAMIRIGTKDEKDLMFKAFIKEYDEFEYKPRKSKNNPEPTIIMESIYDRVARFCINNKSKQAKIQNKSVDEILTVYDESNKVNSICFINATKFENVSKDLTGLIAIKIADKYSKPCLILRKDKYKSNDSDIIFSGSARNINDSFIEDLKSELENSSLFESCTGHSNAFGTSIKKDNIPIAIQYFNNKFNNISNIKTHKVDFIFDKNINYKVIKDIYSIKHLFSGFLKEPLIVIENINVDLMSFDIFGSDEKKHWKFQNDVIEYIRFNVPENDEMLLLDTFTYSNIIMNIIGKTNINVYGSKTTPQFIIQDYMIINKE